LSVKDPYVRENIMIMHGPVCGKHLEDAMVKATSTYEDCAFRFCSIDCKRKFDADPRRYLSDSSLGGIACGSSVH
jgi:Cu+-exporting ATPase